MGRWPWVPRSAFEIAATSATNAIANVNRLADLLEQERAARITERDAHKRETTAQREANERDVVRAEARYAELMASYRMLRLQGHAEPVAIPTIEPPKMDPVLAAVNARAPDAKTRQQMLRQVAIDRKAQISDEEIIMRVQQGHRPADEVQ